MIFISSSVSESRDDNMMASITDNGTDALGPFSSASPNQPPPSYSPTQISEQEIGHGRMTMPLLSVQSELNGQVSATIPMPKSYSTLI